MKGAGSAPLHSPARVRGAAKIKASKKEVSLLVQSVAQRSWNIDRIFRLTSSKRACFDFTTAGSSGRDPTSLLDLMKSPLFDSRLIVDIRASPFSQHTPSWNRPTLSSLASSEGIEYLHMPDLGVFSDMRKKLASGELSHEELFDWYDRNVATDQRLVELGTLVRRRPLFLCTEHGPTYCHRHRLALAFERKYGLVSYDI